MPATHSTGTTADSKPWHAAMQAGNRAFDQQHWADACAHYREAVALSQQVLISQDLSEARFAAWGVSLFNLANTLLSCHKAPEAVELMRQRFSLLCQLAKSHTSPDAETHLLRAYTCAHQDWQMLVQRTQAEDGAPLPRDLPEMRHFRRLFQH